MYRTCVVHAPIPCTVMDREKHLFMVHDRFLLEDDSAAAGQENPKGPEDVGDREGT